MEKKYKNTYRIDSARLRCWDYGWNGAYFVTICTNKRICYFGRVACGEMNLSNIGKIANECWWDIPKHFPFVILDAFVVMPNHVHGIIIINKSNDGKNLVLETQNLASLKQQSKNPGIPVNKFGAQSKNLASIIRGYKIGVTKQARIQIREFGWQPRYYDHIIRDEISYSRMRQYISTNPRRWREDCFNGIIQSEP
ncbi:MAG: transposase [Calditrichaceae bacterium]